jgi:cytochrome c biogenesis protein CcdA
MQEWIHSALSSDQAGITVLIAVFMLGVISVFTCACNFAVIGTVAGYTGTLGATGKTKTVMVSSTFFLLGTVAAMSAIGCLIGYASEFISASMGNYWKIAAGIVAILFGVYTLDILPFKIPGMSVSFQNKKSGIAGSVLFGFIMGGVTSLSSLCCNPIFPVVMAASFVKGSTFWGFFMLFSYSFGYGLTLAAAMAGIGLGLGKISKLMSKFALFLKYAGGITLIALGFYFLITI